MEPEQLLKMAELVRLMADTVRCFMRDEAAVDGTMSRLAEASLTLDTTATELADIAGRMSRA